MRTLPGGMLVAMPWRVKLHPMPKTTSARGRNWKTGPDMTPPPPVPRDRGWFSGNALLPSSVVITGACISSASSSNSSHAWA